MTASKPTAVDLAAAVITVLDVPFPADPAELNKWYDLVTSRAAWMRGVLNALASGSKDSLPATVRTLEKVDELRPLTYQPAS